MIADIIIIAIIGLCIFFGYTRGLIKVGVRILSFVISLVVALILYTPISNYIINNTDIVSNLQNTINSKINNEEEALDEEESAEDKSITEQMGKYIDNYTHEMEGAAKGVISKEVAIAVVRIGTWIGLFLVVKIALIFIGFLSDAIAEIPIIKQFNKARWNNLWNTRRICNYLCITCSI